MAMENSVKNVQKLKIILLGDSGVGKTSLINQYVCKKFQNKPILDFQGPLSKDLEVNNKHVTLQIHDTGGRERQGAGGLEAAFFSDAKGCMLIYDVNDPKSLDNLENWHNEFITRVISNPSSSKGFPFIVLGNKADTDGGRNKEVYNERARKWCESKGIAHFLTSAKDNKYVSEAFLHVAQLALNHETKCNGTPMNVPHVTGPRPPPTSSPILQNGDNIPLVNVPHVIGPRPQPPQSLPTPQNGGNFTIQDTHNINNFPPTYPSIPNTTENNHNYSSDSSYNYQNNLMGKPQLNNNNPTIKPPHNNNHPSYDSQNNPSPEHTPSGGGCCCM